MTDYQYGVLGGWSFKVHGALGVVLTSAALPALLQLEEGSAEAMYFYGQGAGEMLIAGV